MPSPVRLYKRRRGANYRHPASDGSWTACGQTAPVLPLSCATGCTGTMVPGAQNRHQSYSCMSARRCRRRIGSKVAAAWGHYPGRGCSSGRRRCLWLRTRRRKRRLPCFPAFSGARTAAGRCTARRSQPYGDYRYYICSTQKPNYSILSPEKHTIHPATGWNRRVLKHCGISRSQRWRSGWTKLVAEINPEPARAYNASVCWTSRRSAKAEREHVEQMKLSYPDFEAGVFREGIISSKRSLNSSRRGWTAGSRRGAEARISEVPELTWMKPTRSDAVRQYRSLQADARGRRQADRHDLCTRAAALPSSSNFQT